MKYSVLILLVCLWSCAGYKMDGYSKSESGLYYKIHSLGDGEVKAQNGDLVFADIKAFNESGDLLFRNNLFTGNTFQFKLGSAKDGGLNEGLSLLYEGDSASFIMNAENVDLKAITRGNMGGFSGKIKMSVKLNRLDSDSPKSEYVNRKDGELEEWLLLTNYMKSIKDEFYEVDGIYFKPIKEGKGDYIQSGQDIWINYKGYFINGEEFDNTYKYNQALDFQLGKPDQVIRGFEIALHKMKQGGKARLVIPSALAFGDMGSSTGIVPPNTSVIYDLEVMLVN